MSNTQIQPMQIKDAQSYLYLTLRALRLNQTDSDFLVEAMRGYAAKVLSEWLDGESVYKAAPELLEAEENKIRWAKKALEEVTTGNPEKAEHYLQMVVDDTAAIAKARGEA